LASGYCLSARAPSSSANLGSGFDVLAIAHTLYYDEVSACLEQLDGGGFEVRVVRVYGPYAGESGGAETARRAVEALAGRLGLSGVRVVLGVYKGVPPGRGFGGSGASAAAAVYALARLLEKSRGLRVERRVLVEAAGEGEAAAAGSPHYDNVAASLLGGVVVVAHTPRGLRVYGFRPGAPLALAFAVAEPLRVEGKTRAMRAVIPQQLSLSDAVGYAGRAAALAAALARGDLEAAGELMMADELFEARRARLLPCYSEVVREALAAGAYGVSLSGAGPSMVALAPARIDVATRIARAMAKAYSRGGCGEAQPAIARPDIDGARVSWG
jgi:homoserine kinase